MKRLIEVDRREEREVWNGGNGVVFESAGETMSAHTRGLKCRKRF
jgi:hypothetical protein